MKLVTSESMRAIDNECIQNVGIPGLKLMENAGLGTVRFIEREITPLTDKRITVVCGKGNNGGDGFVIARELKSRGATVGAYLAGHRDDVGGDARANLDRLGREGVVELTEGRSIGELVQAMKKSDLVVDAVFGTGFEGVPRGLSGTVIGQINLCGRPVLAVDVPSGLNATTGAAEGECVRARWTCTMGLPKRGFYLHPGRTYVGDVFVVDIGVPPAVIEAVGVRENVLTRDEAGDLLPERPPDAHKGTFGRIVVIAGSVGYSGAAALTAESALRSGAGLVTLGTPVSLNDILETKLTEVITRPLPETESRAVSADALPAVREMLETADAVALGPGLSRDPGTQGLVRAIVSEIDRPCVVDADGLNAISPEAVGARTGTAALVLTPHPGEMSRLTGRAVEDVQGRREDVAREVAEKARATVVLKGDATVVADPDGQTYINPTGNSGLASGGTGDVLTGIVAALLGRGLEGLLAGALGAYVHGAAGDAAAAEIGQISMTAGDVLARLPGVFRSLAAGGGTKRAASAGPWAGRER
jgi:NAD(P)H-hydrate epimerase